MPLLTAMPSLTVSPPLVAGMGRPDLANLSQRSILQCGEDPIHVLHDSDNHAAI